MWDYDSLLGKAERYFLRAAAHPNMDDDEFMLWMLLGLEFLLRAPLAKIHPSLLAAPEGDAILHANGIPTPKDPRSIPTHTVLSRLKQTVADFDVERGEDAQFLTNVRNAELHTGDAALANVPASTWLPRFIRVADVVCAELNVDVADLVTPEVEAHARALVDSDDAKTLREVQAKIRRAKDFYGGLTSAEIDQRTPVLPSSWGPWQKVDCPACQTPIHLKLIHLRAGAEQIDGDEVRSEHIWVADTLPCPVCGLFLEGTAEVAAAGLEQQYVTVDSENLEDRYAHADEYIDFDYGND